MLSLTALQGTVPFSGFLNVDSGLPAFLRGRDPGYPLHHPGHRPESRGAWYGREEFVVDRILGHRVQRDSRGQPQMQWLISWKGYGPVHDEWRSAEDINTGGMELDVWRAYEDQRKLKEPTERERHTDWNAALGRICTIRDNMKERMQAYLQGDKRAHLGWKDLRRPLRVLVLYSGTGSVENAILERYPNSIAVSVDVNPQFQPTHCCTVRQWMEVQGGMESYAPGFFDIIWASPPCT